MKTIRILNVPAKGLKRSKSDRFEFKSGVELFIVVVVVIKFSKFGYTFFSSAIGTIVPVINGRITRRFIFLKRTV